MYIMTDEDGRILASTSEREYAEGMSEWDPPDGFDFSNQDDYILKNGELIFSPRIATESEVQSEREGAKRRQLDMAAALFIRSQAATLSNDEALGYSELFLDWEEDLEKRPDTEYRKGDVRRYKGGLWRYISESPTKPQASWTPDQAHSLWSRIKPDSVEEWEPKVQGRDELYQVGDRCLHDGRTLESMVPNNIWVPGEFGWKEV